MTTEPVATPAVATPAVATIDETLLSPTQKVMVGIIRTAVAEVEKVAPKSERRSVQDILVSLVLDGTDEDVKGLSRFREILSAKASEVFATEQDGTEVSDDERAKVRKVSREAYDAAARILDMPGQALPEGFVLPRFPGSRTASATGGTGEKPRNLKHTVTEGETDIIAEPVTFAVVSQKTKVTGEDLLAAFKAEAGPDKDAWSAHDTGVWVWEVMSGAGETARTFTITTRYDAPAK